MMDDEITAIRALEYAAHFFDRESHIRRSVFILAFVEGEQWAIEDLKLWLADSER